MTPSRCADCDVPEGELHVEGCGFEECATCFGQRVSCACDHGERRLPFALLRPSTPYDGARPSPADLLLAAVSATGTYAVPGFGTFSVRRYEGYEGRDPRTGAIVPVPPTAMLAFKADPAFSEALQREHVAGSAPARTEDALAAALDDVRRRLLARAECVKLEAADIGITSEDAALRWLRPLEARPSRIPPRSARA